MIIEGFEPFVGQHCETTATGSLLKHAGLDLSEPMLFGMGQGLGFIYWDMKSMDFPFMGGRIKQNLLTDNIVRNLGLELERKETSSTKKAWENVRTRIDAGVPVGLQLDSYHLDYFTHKIHFGAHYVAMYGYDDSRAYLVDTAQQGSRVKAALKNLELARNARGPMTSRNLSYTIAKPDGAPDLREAAVQAIRANADDYLNPPIRNIGYKGIEKAAREVRRWFDRTEKPEEDLALAAVLTERGGTGGALFRNMYRDFLGECVVLVGGEELGNGYRMFEEIAPLWTEVSARIQEAGETGEQGHLDRASDLLLELSEKERAAMQHLSKLGSGTHPVPGGTIHQLAAR
jgi:hypothetical protein